jgi:hypothetical protein
MHFKIRGMNHSKTFRLMYPVQYMYLCIYEDIWKCSIFMKINVAS